MESSITECLFFRAYRSFLLQDPFFVMDFEILQQQYKNYPNSFKIFTKNEVIRLVQMEKAYKTGTFNLFQNIPFKMDDVIPPKNEETEQNHKELVFEIYKNRENSIIPYTGGIDDVCPEYPVLYGNIDLLILYKKCAYAIEVKTDTATHSIVGQLMKYYVGLNLKFNLKYFNDVKLITICPGYDQAAHNGLKQIGATILLISPESLKITKI
jgi:hypothetical protein